MRVTATVENLVDAVDVLAHTSAKLVVVDASMEEGSSAVRAVLSVRPNVRVVVVDQNPNVDDMFDFVRAGASGYLDKELPLNALGDALRGVLAGEAAISRRMMTLILDDFRTHANHRMLLNLNGTKLTNREWDVLELVYKGLSTAEIAARLYVSRATVRSHVAAMLHKLKVRDRGALVELLGVSDGTRVVPDTD